MPQTKDAGMGTPLLRLGGGFIGDDGNNHGQYLSFAINCAFQSNSDLM
jgi:hypothetical protein